MRFFDAKQIVISAKVSGENHADCESASASMGTGVPGGSPEGDRAYRRGTATRSLPPRGLCPESLWQENNGDGEKLENWVPRGLFL